jgi:hypothetical protein
MSIIINVTGDKMRYKSEYPQSYTEGIVNKTFSLSKDALDLLNENIENQSAFINDLIIEALQDKAWYKRRLAKQITQMQEEAKKLGVRYELKEVN